MSDNTQSLAIMLVGLALVQGNQKTHVNHELMDVLERLKAELDLN